MQKATAIIPLALLSAAWTASLTGVGLSTASATETYTPGLPDGTSIPATAIEAPASVSLPGAVAPGVQGNARQAVATASTAGIPAAALAAYQRAETVINAADPSCKLSWQLIAAIGRVESDHGRINGNILDDQGVAQPGIYGIALNGKNNTARITDTDAGQYDSDTVFDRAVGPMQFIPSTWSVVGVDADGDAQRNPQDIDDAALASAVYLCSGNDDLSTVVGQRAAVYRYNHSQSYVDLVLSFMNAYISGDFTTVPNGVAQAGYFVPQPSPITKIEKSTKGKKGKGQGKDEKSTPAPPTNNPNPGPDTNPEPPTPPSNPDPKLPKTPKLPKLPPLPTPSTPVDDVLTLAQAIVECTKEGYVDNPLDDNDAFDKCVRRYTN
ncbi:lytic transglycosylase domain-containing protein [Nocardioides sp.]|uniref:lytic transglycosylase domain-containing protein n=1 Tax=Nocardioides sp. TaxID=35761 RepID=UPI003567BA5C